MVSARQRKLEIGTDGFRKKPMARVQPAIHTKTIVPCVKSEKCNVSFSLEQYGSPFLI